MTRAKTKNLSSIVLNLPPDQLQAFRYDLTNASIALLAGKGYKAIFKQRRAVSKGGLKVLYTALYQADKAVLKRMIDVYLEG